MVMDIKDYEKEQQEKKLMMKLKEAEQAIKCEEDGMSLKELKAAVGVE